MAAKTTPWWRLLRAESELPSGWQIIGAVLDAAGATRSHGRRKAIRRRRFRPLPLGLAARSAPTPAAEVHPGLRSLDDASARGCEHRDNGNDHEDAHHEDESDARPANCRPTPVGPEHSARVGSVRRLRGLGCHGDSMVRRRRKRPAAVGLKGLDQPRMTDLPSDAALRLTGMLAWHHGRNARGRDDGRTRARIGVAVADRPGADRRRGDRSVDVRPADRGHGRARPCARVLAQRARCGARCCPSR